MNEKKNPQEKISKNDKKEKCIIFALAGILLMIVCLPVKQKDDVKRDGNKSQVSVNQSVGEINSDSYLMDEQQDLRGYRYSVSDDGQYKAEDYAEMMEQELEELLQCMEGAGKVRVMITLRSTGEDIVEKDRPAVRSNMTENDGAGGNRSTNDFDSEETTVFLTDAEGRQIPYVRKTLQPVIEGVAVLAEGGEKEAVRRNISETIQALFGIDANKIKIAKMKTVK